MVLMEFIWKYLLPDTDVQEMIWRNIQFMLKNNFQCSLIVANELPLCKFVCNVFADSEF